MACSDELSSVLVRTVRALKLIGKPISVVSLSGSYPLGPTIAALRWLLARGYAGSGTAHISGNQHVPVYWLTDHGIELHRRLTRRDTGTEPDHEERS